MAPFGNQQYKEGVGKPKSTIPGPTLGHQTVDRHPPSPGLAALWWIMNCLPNARQTQVRPLNGRASALPARLMAGGG
jgi:hypothetical protein